MALNQDDIEKIARLAKFKPTAEEKQRLLTDLNKILEYMEIINEIEVEHQRKPSSPEPPPATIREDIVKPGLTHKQALANAPQSRDGMFAVPKVIDNQDLS